MLQNIVEQARSYGDTMQSPCSLVQLQNFRIRAKKELQIEIPEEYVDFLRLHNGLDWNGLTLYASETVLIEGYTDRFILGCVEANLLRRDYDKWKHFLIFAETGDEDYCLEITTSQYVIVDSVSMDILETFASFDQLIAEAFRDRI